MPIQTIDKVVFAFICAVIEKDLWISSCDNIIDQLNVIEKQREFNNNIFGFYGNIQDKQICYI